MTYTDPDLSTIRSHAAGKGSSARINDTAGQVSGTTGKVTGATDGGGPEKFTGDAAEIGKTLSALATDAAISTEIWGDLNKAADAWTANAPKAEEMDSAEKAVTDAQAACTAANEKADANPDDKDLQKAADDAGTALIKAKQHLIDLQRKRKAAVKALLEAIGRAITKAKRITGGRTQHGTGKEMPGTGTPTETGTGSGTQSTGSGAPAGTPAATPGGALAATPKPTGTPAATPASTPTPTSSTKGGGLDSSDVAAIAALAGQNQNGQQQPQTQQAAQSMPTMPQVPQQANQQDGKDKGKTGEHSLATDGIFGTDDAARVTGQTPSAVLSSFGNTPSTPAPTPTPASQPTTALRPEFKPAPLTAAAAANPITSGTSQSGLVTSQGNSEVSGRAEPQRTAFSATPAGAETKTSGAHGTETAQNQGTQQRPTGTGAAPGMLPSAGAVGGPASPAGRQGDGEANRIIGRGPNGERLLGDQEAVGEAVPGGTIAQNKPDRAA